MVERRIKQARFPAVKSLDSFDFIAIPSLNPSFLLPARAKPLKMLRNAVRWPPNRSHVIGHFRLVRR
jgi:hypothetical protein